MKNDFSNFKNKYKIEAIIKTLIVSISLCILFEGIIILLCKTIPLHHNIIIEIILNVLLFTLSFILLKSKFTLSDKEVAKRIDEKDNLKEKVQTMVEFQNNDSLMAKIQKEDTTKKIENVSTKDIKYKFTFKNFACLVVAILLLFSTFFIKQKDFPLDASDNTSSSEEESSSSEESKSEEEESSSSEGNETSGEDSTENGQSGSKEDKINDLIDKVDNADIDESLKDEIKKDLEDLKDNLNKDEGNKDKEDQDIEDTKEDVDNDVNKSNSASQIGESLKKEDSTKDLGEQISNKDSDGASSSLDQMREDLKDKTGDELKDALDKISNDIKDALQDAKENGVSEDDSLYKALDDFANDLSSLKDKVNDSDIQDQISSSFDDLKEALKDSLNKQNNASNIKDEIKDALDDMKNDQSSSGDEKDDENKDDDGSGSAGGGDTGSTGKGEIIYASDDKIYDPITNSYVTYGELIDYYNSLVLQGMVDGNLSDDLQALISAYFSSLYNDESQD